MRALGFAPTRAGCRPAVNCSSLRLRCWPRIQSALVLGVGGTVYDCPAPRCSPRTAARRRPFADMNFSRLRDILSASGDNSAVYQRVYLLPVIPQPEMRGKDRRGVSTGDRSAGDRAIRAACIGVARSDQCTGRGPLGFGTVAISRCNSATCAWYSSWYRSHSPR